MNVRPEAIKLLDEHMGGKLLGISLGDDLATKAKINMSGLLQTNKLLLSE